MGELRPPDRVRGAGPAALYVANRQQISADLRWLESRGNKIDGAQGYRSSIKARARLRLNPSLTAIRSLERLCDEGAQFLHYDPVRSPESRLAIAPGLPRDFRVVQVLGDVTNPNMTTAVFKPAATTWTVMPTRLFPEGGWVGRQYRYYENPLEQFPDPTNTVLVIVMQEQPPPDVTRATRRAYAQQAVPGLLRTMDDVLAYLPSDVVKVMLAESHGTIVSQAAVLGGADVDLRISIATPGTVFPADGLEVSIHHPGDLAYESLREDRADIRVTAYTEEDRAAERAEIREYLSMLPPRQRAAETLRLKLRSAHGWMNNPLSSGHALIKDVVRVAAAAKHAGDDIEPAVRSVCGRYVADNPVARHPVPPSRAAMQAVTVGLGLAVSPVTNAADSKLPARFMQGAGAVPRRLWPVGRGGTAGTVAALREEFLDSASRASQTEMGGEGRRRLALRTAWLRHRSKSRS
ncbi:MAG TPA: hypothetical protein VHU91_11280 [Mycobacteriales bacterium]|jgi:hypothetical protein|nr:hypothetical protein [Mycobacteriales bacterium]